jgi:peptidoglycan/xylan/chitin deacetylase (PgdA/CDA1 family)
MGKLHMIKDIIDSLEHIPPDIFKKILKTCLWEGTPDSGTLALTFDDGPDPEVTPSILDILEELEARGTFFLTGDNVKKHPHIARMISEKGHTIGNHSMSHRKLFLIRKNEVEYEIDEAQKVISDATGIKPVWFRPPYGIFDFTCSGVAKKRGISIVLWTVLSGDYSYVSSEEILRTVKPFIRPGAIQVFHDTRSGGGVALRDIIMDIGSMTLKKGIKLGSIEELTFTED